VPGVELAAGIVERIEPTGAAFPSKANDVRAFARVVVVREMRPRLQEKTAGHSYADH